MKSPIVISLSLAMLLCFEATPQCDCSAPLSSDLMDISAEYNEAQFRDFLYQYFTSSKAERKNLKKAYSGSFGLQGLVDGLPLGANSTNSSSRDEKAFYAFEQEVLNNHYVSHEIIESLVTKTFSNNQLAAYTECLKLKCGHNNNVTVEYGGDLFDVFYVRVIFNNPISTALLEMDSDAQYSGCTPVYGLTLAAGTVLRTGEDVIQYFKRDHPEKVALVNLNFKGFSWDPIRLEGKKSAPSIPIGSIIASALTFSEFHSQSTDKAFNPSESLWAPCDGRNVIGSNFSSRYQMDFAPDLRGQFLRGNFSMGGPSEAPQKTPNGTNPRDGEYSSNGYIYQNDMTRKHTHSGWVGRDANGNPDGSRDRRSGAQTGGAADRYPVWPQQINSVGGTETRPMNMYVYYYIRIN